MARPAENFILDDPYRSSERPGHSLPLANAPFTESISSTDDILLIRLGGIGDAIRLLPTAVFLRNSGFDGSLHCAVEPPVQHVLGCTEHIDHVHSFPLKDWKTRLPDIFHLIDQVRTNVFDWVFDCHGIFKSGLLARLTRSRRRIGYHPSNAKELNSLFMDYTISGVNTDLPRLLKYLQLVRPFVPEKNLEKSQIKPSFTRIQPVRPDVQKLADREPILIHPSSSTGRYGTRKDWGVANVQSLIRRIRQDVSRQIRITWGPSERSIARKIAEPFPNQVQPAPATSPITNLLYLIQKSYMLITIDSSPAHIADFLDTPTVVIFGVGKTRINAPFFTRYRVVTRADQEEHTTDIPVERVVRAYRRLRNEIEQPSRTESHPG